MQLEQTEIITDLQREKRKPEFLQVIFISLLSIFASSFASPFSRIVMDGGVNPVWVSSLRMATMFIISFPAILLSRKLRYDVLHVTWNETKWMILAGFFLAAHFFTLALSLNNTSVFGSCTIGSTQYLFTIVVAAIFLKEKRIDKTIQYACNVPFKFKI